MCTRASFVNCLLYKALHQEPFPSLAADAVHAKGHCPRSCWHLRRELRGTFRGALFCLSLTVGLRHFPRIQQSWRVTAWLPKKEFSLKCLMPLTQHGSQALTHGSFSSRNPEGARAWFKGGLSKRRTWKCHLIVERGLIQKNYLESECF